ncbi:gamma-glutamyl-gamma-aminobutyrate hydrolase family protein [Piscinibacter sp.]|uniref:gamma-glutamyl-gamma-aminobutyrate hydrolase family protein n=1 Tax=Piscinibacter sp. TaxID=1903157 RepID=UPI002F3E5955
MDRLKIGISACFFHADPARTIFTGKTLQYVEQSVAHWVMAGGALAVMIPNPQGDTRRGDVTLEHYAQWLDGLVLEGGSDLWPGSYRETPLQEGWNGDRIRDDYEIALASAFIAAGKPVFGVCRGLQLLNVAFGGTLHQDIATQRPDAIAHREAALYDRHFHDVEFVAGSRLAQLYPGVARAKVNSVHHQAIKDLASGLVVEARCPDDGVIEAVRRPGASFVAAVQWHPEFHRQELGTLDDAPILQDFLDAARAARTRCTP